MILLDLWIPRPLNLILLDGGDLGHSQKFLVDHNIELTRTVTCPMPDKHRMLKDRTPLGSGDEQLFGSITESLS